jgi:hypothetical protein
MSTLFDGILESGCGCHDCEAAMSPGAYLASLLDYTLKHVRNEAAIIDLPFLEARYHQPFSSLPIDCESTEEQVRQVRLAAEVLRGYLGPRPLADAEAEKTLLAAEAGYRLAAYTQLLSQLGTTHEEVRRARSAAPAERAALAERLGISLTPAVGAPRQDELDRLLLEPALPAGDPQALTEQNVERVFGLPDTGRDPLSEGVKLGDEKEQITRWDFDGADWNLNTDAEGKVYLSLVKLAANAFAAQVFGDGTRLQLVASGKRETGVGPLRLTPENGSGLSGSIEIAYQSDDGDISFVVVPLLRGWCLGGLYARWETEDWPNSPTPASEAGLAPIIDPQVIGFQDLRSAHAGDKAFDLWLARFRNCL